MSDFAVIGSRLTGEAIEVFPGYFVEGSVPCVELTEDCMNYLRTLCADYMAGKVDADEVISNIQTVSRLYSGYSDMVSDKMWYELNKIMEG